MRHYNVQIDVCFSLLSCCVDSPPNIWLCCCILFLCICFNVSFKKHTQNIEVQETTGECTGAVTTAVSKRQLKSSQEVRGKLVTACS